MRGQARAGLAVRVETPAPDAAARVDGEGVVCACPDCDGKDAVGARPKDDALGKRAEDGAALGDAPAELGVLGRAGGVDLAGGGE